ncbi:MAG: membrane dipeptidase [Acidobacteria bacterium]|nr:membrane dipeptidase [Acidobacteriota bacterium]
MIVIDAHLDLSWNALGWNRDLRQSVAEIRASEAGLPQKGRGTNTVAFPEMRSGKVGICLATVLARSKPRGATSIDFRNQEIAFAVAQGQLAYYRVLEEQGAIRFIRNAAELSASFAEWKSSPATAPFGFVLAMEGADPIVNPAQVERWRRDGLRVVGLTHYGASPYGHGTGSDGPLTPAGVELLNAMADAGMILDLTHLADESFWQALKLWKGPVLASHNNCRALVPGGRQFSDDQIRAIIERHGVIGAAFDAWMLAPDWTLSMEPKVQIKAVVDHMDHICQLAGNARHIAIGSDLDGGYGTEQTPAGLDTIADLQKIALLLGERGHSEADVAAAMHGNWMRCLETAWAEAA